MCTVRCGACRGPIRLQRRDLALQFRKSVAIRHKRLLMERETFGDQRADPREPIGGLRIDLPANGLKVALPPRLLLLQGLLKVTTGDAHFRRR